MVGFYSGKHAEEGIDVLDEGSQGVMVLGYSGYDGRRQPGCDGGG